LAKTGLVDAAGSVRGLADLLLLALKGGWRMGSPVATMTRKGSSFGWATAAVS
jgi:hypothetical protein